MFYVNDCPDCRFFDDEAERFGEVYLRPYPRRAKAVAAHQRKEPPVTREPCKFLFCFRYHKHVITKTFHINESIPPFPFGKECGM